MVLSVHRHAGLKGNLSSVTSARSCHTHTIMLAHILHVADPFEIAAGNGIQIATQTTKNKPSRSSERYAECPARRHSIAS